MVRGKLQTHFGVHKESDFWAFCEWMFRASEENVREN